MHLISPEDALRGREEPFKKPLRGFGGVQPNPVDRAKLAWPAARIGITAARRALPLCPQNVK